MTFADFIKKYYPPARQTEVIFLLNDLHIYTTIESSLNDFYQAAARNSRYGIISQFVLTSREFVTSLYQPLHESRTCKTNAAKEKKIAELVTYLVKETYQLSGLAFAEYYDLFIETAKETYIKYRLDFSVLEGLLNSLHVKALTASGKERENSSGFKLSRPVKLDWRGDKQLDLFIDDLTKTFQDVRCKKHLFLLFDRMKSDFKIELSSKHLLPFLTLFYALHEAGAIRVSGNRGLFVYLRQHLQAPPNDKYPKRDFRKLRHEAGQNERTKNNISRMIKPLLDKYCPSGR
jgi:hypothetical protein